MVKKSSKGVWVEGGEGVVCLCVGSAGGSLDLTTSEGSNGDHLNTGEIGKVEVTKERLGLGVDLDSIGLDGALLGDVVVLPLSL